MNKVLTIGITILTVAGLLLGGYACAPAPAAKPTPAPPKTLDIGIATPLTGTYAFIGTQIQNAALLAIDDQNEQGGVTIAGQKYVLNPIIRDTKWDLVLGKTIAEELVFDKGVKIITGPFISDAIGAQTVTEPNKVITFLQGLLYLRCAVQISHIPSSGIPPLSSIMLIQLPTYKNSTRKQKQWFP